MGRRLGGLIGGAAVVLAACTAQNTPSRATETPLVSPTPVSTATPVPTSAAPGALDPTFGRGGIVTTDIADSGGEDRASAIAIDADGRIVVVGTSSPEEHTYRLALVRYEPDGRLDQSFGQGGLVTAGFSGSAVVIDSNGRIVVAGDMSSAAMGSDFALARYNADGSLDTAFGNDGLVTTDFPRTGALDTGSIDGASAIVIDGDGRIIVAGGSGFFLPTDEMLEAQSYDFALARYDADGSLDPTFGRAGLVTTDISGAGSNDLGWAMAVDPDGRIVVAGSTREGGGSSSSALARYTPDGSLDATFGDGGLVTTDFVRSGSADEGSELGAIAIDAQGRIVAVVSIDIGDLALARYRADGSLDAGFGDGGLLITNLGGHDAAHAIVIDSAGRIVVAGSSDADFAIARYVPDGSLDALFGYAGWAKTDCSGSGSRDFSWAIAIDADGRIVVAGESSMVDEKFEVGDSDFAIARYIGS